MKTREIFDFSKNLTTQDIDWRPLYPNNMLCNDQCGWYAFLWIKDEDGLYYGRKYTILFQEEEDEKGCTQRGKTELFILLEKRYYDLQNPIIYPDPSERPKMTLRTVSDYLDINSYGDFVRAYKSENEARERALKQFKMVFAYAMSYLIEEEGK